MLTSSVIGEALRRRIARRKLHSGELTSAKFATVPNLCVRPGLSFSRPHFPWNCERALCPHGSPCSYVFPGSCGFLSSPTTLQLPRLSSASRRTSSTAGPPPVLHRFHAASHWMLLLLSKSSLTQRSAPASTQQTSVRFLCPLPSPEMGVSLQRFLADRLQVLSNSSLHGWATPLRILGPPVRELAQSCALIPI